MFFVYLGWAHLLCLLTREDLRTNERLILINGIKPSFSKSSVKILDQNKISQIKKCINNFSSISREDIGYSKDVSGTAFLPIPNHRQLLICRSKFSLEENNQLLEVVKIGPDALPYLIDALTCTIPTNITVNNIDTKFEFDCNEAILEELLFKNKHSIKMDQESSGKSLPQYKLKVGDISFVAVGQIIGRKYEAMHYQMTDSIIVNGPLINPEIAKYIKLSFAGQSVREKLFEKLLLDYSTVSTSKIIDPFTLSRISSIRVEAALRLLYYYPNETLELFLHDLDNLDVKNVESTDSRKQRHDQMSREIKNGYLKTDEYVKALASIKHPKIKSAIIAIAKKTDDTDILIGTLEAFSDQDLDILRDIASKHAASITSNERISPYTEVDF